MPLQQDFPCYDPSKYNISEETEKLYKEGLFNKYFPLLNLIISGNAEDDAKKSINLLEKAAEGGHPLAMHGLGMLLFCIH